MFVGIFCILMMKDSSEFLNEKLVNNHGRNNVSVIFFKKDLILKYKLVILFVKITIR